MKLITLLLAFYFSPAYSAGQSSLVDLYNSHHFECDSGGRTGEINICSGIKVEYADSLLNSLYRKILKSIDKEITADKIKLDREKSNTKNHDKDDINFRIRNIRYNQRLKKSIVSSQRQWVGVRDSNMEVAQINCEGGTGCVAMANEDYLDDTLARIKKLESFYSVDH